MDRITCWPEVALLSSISTESCLHAFFATWVSRFGIPAIITSDRGAQFTSSVWAVVCASLSISVSTTTSFHPQSNGLKDDTDLSVSKAVFRAPLTVPGEFLDSSELPPAAWLIKIEQAVVGFAVSPPHHVLKTQPLSAALMSARYVFVGEDASIPSLAPLYCGPCLVLEKSDKYFRLQLGSRTDVVSMDRLKPVFLI